MCLKFCIGYMLIVISRIMCEGTFETMDALYALKSHYSTQYLNRHLPFHPTILALAHIYGLGHRNEHDGHLPSQPFAHYSL
jgi:hypothetical protein